MSDASFFLAEVLPILLPELFAKSTPWIPKLTAQKLSRSSASPSTRARTLVLIPSKPSWKWSRNQSPLVQSKRVGESEMNGKKPPRQSSSCRQAESREFFAKRAAHLFNRPNEHIKESKSIPSLTAKSHFLSATCFGAFFFFLSFLPVVYDSMSISINPV